MPLVDALRARRLEIAAQWCATMLASYPEESRRFYTSEQDPFRNPVGATVRHGAATLLDAVLSGEWGREAEAALDAIVRLRSIQGFSPSQALGFVGQLKRVLRAAVTREGQGFGDEFALLDERVDGLLLRSLDCYVACRDRLHELKEREAKARIHSLLKRAGMLDGSDGAGGQEGEVDAPST